MKLELVAVGDICLIHYWNDESIIKLINFLLIDLLFQSHFRTTCVSGSWMVAQLLMPKSTSVNCTKDFHQNNNNTRLINLNYYLWQLQNILGKPAHNMDSLLCNIQQTSIKLLAKTHKPAKCRHHVSTSHPAAPSLTTNCGMVRTQSTSPLRALQGRHGRLL